MLMEITFKTQLLTQFSKRVAIKEQKDPRRLSLGQSIWPLGVTATLKEQNAAECMMSCIMDLARFIFTRLTGNKLCNIYYTQYRCSVGTSCNPTRGASRVDHKKKKKSQRRKRCEATTGHGYNHRLNTGLQCCWRPCADLWRPLETAPFALSSPSPVLCSSLYAAGRMSTWSCQT